MLFINLIELSISIQIKEHFGLFSSSIQNESNRKRTLTDNTEFSVEHNFPHILCIQFINKTDEKYIVWC